MPPTSSVLSVSLGKKGNQHRKRNYTHFLEREYTPEVQCTNPSTGLKQDAHDPRIICQRCEALNLHEVFTQPIKSDLGVYVANLGESVEELRTSDCDLCQLFACVSPGDLDEGAARIKSCHIRAFSANRAVVGLKPQEMIETPDTNLLGVLRIKVADTITGENYAYSKMRRSLEETGYLCFTPTSQSTPRFGVRQICHKNIDIEFARNCLSYCRKHHSEPCSPKRREAMEFFRVIDCQTRTIITASRDCQYVALSYVWGEPVADTSTPPKEDEKKPIQKNCPRVINDSIEVTLQLNLRYLWVDKYCINQADAKEKHYQIKHMDLVYANSQVTIIAAAGADPSYGLPGVAGTLRKNQPKLAVKDGTIASTLSASKWLVKNSKWASRGWTFQEGILSKRRLFFTDQQIFWECNSMNCAESLILPLENMHTRNGKILKSWVHGSVFHWKTPGAKPWDVMGYVASYNNRQLTFAEDMLNAMQGIFQAFAKSRIPVYQVMGVPILSPIALSQGPPRKSIPRSAEESFLIGLCWSSNKPGDRRPHFPSWSWVGWTGQLFPFLNFEKTWTISVKDTKIWFEENDNKLLSFPAFDSLTLLLSRASFAPRFIHIEGWTFSCSIVENLWLTEIPGRYYVKLPLGDEQFIYLKFHADREIKNGDGKDTGFLGKPLTGIIFGDLNSDSPEFMVLVVEEMGDCAERVGCFSTSFINAGFRSNANDLYHVHENLYPLGLNRSSILAKWLKNSVKMRRRIRIG